MGQLYIWPFLVNSPEYLFGDNFIEMWYLHETGVRERM